MGLSQPILPMNELISSPKFESPFQPSHLFTLLNILCLDLLGRMHTPPAFIPLKFYFTR